MRLFRFVSLHLPQWHPHPPQLRINYLSADTIDLRLRWPDINKSAGKASHASINAVEGARSRAIQLNVADRKVVLDKLDGAVDGEGLGEAGVGRRLKLDCDIRDGAGLVLEGLVGEGGGGGGEGGKEGEGEGGDGDGLHGCWRFGRW
jgi:hypothetical protein